MIEPKYIINKKQGFITYGIIASNFDMQIPFSVFKTKNGSIEIDELIEGKKQFIPNDTIQSLIENKKGDFFKIITNPKEAYSLFVNMQIDAMRAKYGYAKENIFKPLLSYDLITEVYFPLAKKLFIERNLYNSIDKATDEIIDSLTEKFIDLEINAAKMPPEYEGDLSFKKKYSYHNQELNKKRYGKFLEQKKIEHNTKAELIPSVPIQKIIWKGQQKQLVELLVELEKKGWIEKIETGYRKKTISTLLSVIDFKKKFKGDFEGSIYQKFKGDFDKEDGTLSHDFGKRYKPNFSEIKKCNL